MKALRWYARQDLRYEDVPEPSTGSAQVKVKIVLAGICGADLREYIDGPHVISPDRVPVIEGHEFVGKVVELGEGVTEFKVGDRVTGLSCWYCGECFFCRQGFYNLCEQKKLLGASVDGCMAEFMVAPAKIYYKLPDTISDEIGALVEPLSVGLHAIHRGNVRPGTIVVVVGDGTIGLCALIAARAAGASAVYVVSKHANRGKIASNMGASQVIDIRNGDPAERIKAQTRGLGAAIAFDCVGNNASLKLCINLIRRGGTAVLIGASDQPNTLNFMDVLANEKNIIGSLMYIREATEAIALLSDGRVHPESLISAQIPLKDAVEKGFKRLLNNKEDNLKILLRIS
jgi:(R,R)-butanediol dehydrogenase / meso-butanediol dehydrogenase / diacetyl reductase